MIFNSLWNYLNLAIIQTCVSSSKYTSIYSNHLWSKNITISTACLNTHWTAHIKNVLLPTSYFLVPSHWKTRPSVILPMWYDLHVSSDSKSSESKRSICMEFLHAFIPTGMVCMSQTFQKWVSTKIHQHGASSCILHQHDSSGSATTKWYYHYYFVSFGTNIMNMCNTTIEIQ